VRDLGRGPERVVVTLRLDDDRARLHEGRDQPLLDEPPADDDVRVGEGLLRVGSRAGLAGVEDEVVAGVRRRVVVAEIRFGLDRLVHVEHHGQQVVVDVDELDGVLGGDLAAGDDHRDGLTDVVDLVHGDRGVPGIDHVGGDRPGAGDRSLFFGEVASRVDGDDARRLLGGGDVDVGDLPVRDGAADHREVEHARQDHVVGPGRAAGDQPCVLLAAARLPDLLGRGECGGVLGDGHDCTATCGAAAVSTTAGATWAGGTWPLPEACPLISAAACCTARTMFW
jgi:hypothetical protein